ncbi:hypothetical protein [Nonomuraea jiangxiensis]|uniref:Uncharacterized protein n=1 Tax=Nonomuraea jiangxiensis TaxID=633440 RepID=A0A1G9RCD4_9ACTN|nr:hypothetical protein [Nonomuraea jiangxiensis]SDM20095.1 hypothetical protein SAMN05421869_13818 [Nonomuraea jiangxiensis]
MRSIPRRIAAAAVVAGGLTLLTAPAAHAVLDPIGVATCLASSATEVTALVDPANPGVPAEVPAMGCLQP